MRSISRVICCGALLLSPLAACGAEMRKALDQSYGEGGERNALDVYAPTSGAGHPVIVWIHGGGWRRGDKSGVQLKPQAFVDRGYVFVSINYRFFPNVTIKEMTGDVARAIRWTRDHAAEFGGDPNALVVMGHSAGAHLAALVCTDDSYLKAVDVPLASIRGCVPLDVSVYDIPKRRGETPKFPFPDLFGETPEEQRDLSPALHVAKDKHIPAFLILHVADREETKVQSQTFADQLIEAGVPAQVFAAEGKTHGTINSDVGVPDDPVTKAIDAFLAQCQKKQGA